MSKKINLSVFLFPAAVVLGFSACASAPVKPIQPEKPSPVVQDRDALTLGFAEGDTADRVTKNLQLPAAGASGLTTVEWLSSDPAVVGSDGTVLPPVLRDRHIVLTALLKAEGDERRKVFNLMVPRKEVRQPYPQTSLKVTVDGDLKEWRTPDRIPSSTPGVSYLLAWDEENLYLGAEGDFIDIHGPKARETWLGIYIGFDDGDPAASDQGEFFRSQNYQLPFKASYFIKWRVSDSYILSGVPRPDRTRSNRILWGFGVSPSSPDYNPLGLTRKSVAVGQKSLEMAIPLELLGRPSRFRVVSLVIQETDGEETTYALLPATAGSDGPGFPEPKTFSAFLTLDLTSRQGALDQSLGKTEAPPVPAPRAPAPTPRTPAPRAPGN